MKSNNKLIFVRNSTRDLLFTAGESRCIKPKFQVHQQAEFTVKKDDKFKIALLSLSFFKESS